ncbi:MAG TPA: DUF2786 domain-containing protein [Trebonia sp.]|nr:DUF2786 domain-containing protein [Trebonia sp.]
MGKAGRQRRQRKEQARQRARSAYDRPAPGHVPSQREQVSKFAGDAIEAVCSGDERTYRSSLDQLAAERSAEWTQTVSRVLVDGMRSLLAHAWRRGWQPAELARHFGRELGAAHAAMIADMIADETRAYPAAAIDPRWVGQVGGLRAASYGPATYEGPNWWGSDGDYLTAWKAQATDPTFWAAVATAVESMHLFSHLPPLEVLLPIPGTVRRAGAAKPASAPAGEGSASAPDERMLGRIRALLAKAESTEFAEEAEALSARAQELMAKYSIDHALLAARSGEREEPSGRRIPVDSPYEEPKGTLLNVIALANRCRAVWSKNVGLMTVVGFPADLDAVELLFTSLLVQANTAMLRAGGKKDEFGRSRTRAFRQSFLVSYAIRIGERLEEATAHATAEAVDELAAVERDSARAVTSGTDLVPFLAARQQAVDDAVGELFGGNLKRGRAARVTDAEGWTSGRAAADLAKLHNRQPVAN